MLPENVAQISSRIRSIPGSGRWAEVPLSEADAATVTPETAAGLIDAAPWYVYGGSYFGHAGKRGSGPMRWGP